MPNTFFTPGPGGRAYLDFAPAPAAFAPSPGPALADTAAEIRRLADEAEQAAAHVTFPSNR